MLRASRLLPAVLAFCAWCLLLSGGVWAAETKTEAKTEAVKPADVKPADVKPADKPAEKKPAKKTAQVVRFTIKGDYPEGPSPPALFGEMQPSLATVIERMDEAAADKDVAAVWLQIEDLDIGRGKIHELRAAIARLRKAGKPVYAELTTAERGQYLLAAACDEVVMPPSGMLILPGVRAEVTFYKGLLDKLGVQFDALQMGKYKGAAEPFTRTEHERAAAREHRRPGRRHLRRPGRHDRRRPQAEGLPGQDAHRPGPVHAPTAAKKAGLIDEVLYADQLRGRSRKKLKVDELERRHQLQEEAGRHRFLRHRRHDEADGADDGRQAVGDGQHEAEDRRGLRRRPDHGRQERERHVRRLGRRLDHARRRPAKAADDPKVVGHRAAHRQPRRIGHRPAT